jgi:hypothetical protein
MTKRIADWLEKMSVAALAIGIFQLSISGIIIGCVAFAGMLALTKYIQKRGLNDNRMELDTSADHICDGARVILCATRVSAKLAQGGKR